MELNRKYFNGNTIRVLIPGNTTEIDATVLNEGSRVLIEYAGPNGERLKITVPYEAISTPPTTTDAPYPFSRFDVPPQR